MGSIENQCWHHLKLIWSALGKDRYRGRLPVLQREGGFCTINSTNNGSINQWDLWWAKFKRKEFAFFSLLPELLKHPWFALECIQVWAFEGTQSLNLPLTVGFWHCCNAGHISIMEALHFPNKIAPLVREISLEIRGKQQNTRYFQFGAYHVYLGAHLPIP